LKETDEEIELKKVAQEPFVSRISEFKSNKKVQIVDSILRKQKPAMGDKGDEPRGKTLFVEKEDSRNHKKPCDDKKGLEKNYTTVDKKDSGLENKITIADDGRDGLENKINPLDDEHNELEEKITTLNKMSKSKFK
jgi:septal ring factor EnvC (AmiA/AmiB activator)